MSVNLEGVETIPKRADGLNRRGMFAVSGMLIAAAGYGGMLELMGDVLVVRAAPNQHGEIEYQGIAPHFEEVADGCSAPWYDVQISERHEDGKLVGRTVEWIKRP